MADRGNVRVRRGLQLALCAAILTCACGKKGPPLAPLRLVPGPMADVTARRVGTEVQLHFKLPTANANGPGRIDLDHVEVYAVTVAPGTVTPPNPAFLTKTYMVSTMPVKPPPVEGEGEPEPAAGTPPDSRPGPGDEVSYVEELTEARMIPAKLPKAPPYVPPLPALTPLPSLPVLFGDATPAVAAAAPAGTNAPAPAPAGQPAAPPATGAAPAPPAGTAAPAAPAAGAAPGLPAAGAAPAAAPGAPGQAPPAGLGPPPPAAGPPPVAGPPPTILVRVYMIRGVTRSGRPGPPSARIVVPLTPSPDPPSGIKTTFTEKSTVLEWTPPPVAAGTPPAAVTPAAGAAPVTGAPPAATAPAVAFNVYRVDTKVKEGEAVKAAVPLNPAPLPVAKFELPEVQIGVEQCFAIRSVAVVENVAVESDAAPNSCATARDVFPPAAPQGLSLLILDGALDLVWDANAEPDVAGYTLWRAEGADGALRPLTPAPIRETTFRDTTVRSGVQYTYAVVAVDRAGNPSPQSARVEGTAR